jgi:hypothetical protein
MKKYEWDYIYNFRKKNIAVIMQDFEILSGAVEVKHGVFRNSGSRIANEFSSFGELPY